MSNKRAFVVLTIPTSDKPAHQELGAILAGLDAEFKHGFRLDTIETLYREENFKEDGLPIGYRISLRALAPLPSFHDLEVAFGDHLTQVMYADPVAQMRAG